MAKRDIPEINAGSMADIAFLLLIFFLVTTTMDRDKAYIRTIPKKVKTNIPPPDIQQRDILEIRANSANRLMVRGEAIPNPDDISDKVLEFFRTNEKLSDAEMRSAITNRAHPGFEFPFYNKYSMKDIDDGILKATIDAEETEKMDGVEDELIDFYWNKVREWEKKKTALKLYGKTTLPEISSQAHVRVVVQSKTGYELFAKIQSEIEEALFEMRDDAAQRIWGIGYGKIITRLGSDPKDSDYKKKKDLLEALYPGRIIEVTPKQ